MVGLVDARIDRASFGAELRWTGAPTRVSPGAFGVWLPGSCSPHRWATLLNWALLVVVGSVDSLIGYWLSLAMIF